MKKIVTPDDELLLEYLDGTLPQNQVTELEELLRAAPALQQRLEDLRSVAMNTTHIRLEQPSKNFTQRVMENLNSSPVRSGISIRTSLLLLAGVLVAMGLTSLLLALGIYNESTAIDLNRLMVNPDLLPEKLPTIALSSKWIVNGIIVANLVLAFLLLDRAVLKPWFERRTQMHY
jgi:anti-sigma factor RsiW